MKRESWRPPKSTVDELMNLAGVPNNEHTMRALCGALEWSKGIYARGSVRDLVESRRGAGKAYGRIAKAAQALSAAMDAVSYFRQTNIRTTWISNQEGVQAEVRRIRTIAERHVAHVRPGQPRKLEKVSVVRDAMDALACLDRGPPERRLPNKSRQAYYASLLHENLNAVPTKRRLSNKHREFIELFYETVTGETDVRGALEWQIRQAKRLKQTAS